MNRNTYYKLTKHKKEMAEEPSIYFEHFETEEEMKQLQMKVKMETAAEVEAFFSGGWGALQQIGEERNGVGFFFKF